MDAAPMPPLVDRATLAGPVRRLLGSDRAEIVGWESTPITTGSGDPLTGGLFRIDGTAHDGARLVPWSMVLKIAKARRGNHDPSHQSYWRREVTVYQSGLHGDLDAGLAAPRCLGVVQRSATEIWLWLEELIDAAPDRWEQAQYGLVAHQLGRFNGAFLVGRPLPGQSCLRTPWLWHYVERSGPAIARLATVAEHPLVRRAYPGTTVADLLRLWAERERFFAALSCVPHTFCHRDAWRGNVFFRHGGTAAVQAVAIDWTFAGIGAVGEDLGPLVVPSLGIAHASKETSDVDRIVFARYLDGLADAGWRGDPRLVRLGYATTTALRYGLGIAREVLRLLLDEGQHPWATRAYGWPIEEWCDCLGEQLRATLPYADEARRLIEALCGQSAARNAVEDRTGEAAEAGESPHS